MIYLLTPIAVVVYFLVLGIVASASRIGDKFEEEDVLAGIFWPVIGAILAVIAIPWLLIRGGVWIGELPGKHQRKEDERNQRKLGDLERTRKIIAELEAVNGIGDET